jgi:S-DNA-T family DNA segregation ATPase FtsK/SpoIIIE
MTTVLMPAVETEREVPTVPVDPGLSMYDPLYVGVDEFGTPVYTKIVYRNLLAGGEPGGGKSGLLNTICGHAALCTDTRLVLFDGKLVELGPWKHIADEFVGPDLDHAIAVLERLQAVLNKRYQWLDAHTQSGTVRRKLDDRDHIEVILTVIDELALFSATLGTKTQQDYFVALLRDLVSRGRAAAMPVVAATQRPSHDIIPTSLRDLFGYRAAFRCTTPNSSNIILGNGWAEQGYNAQDIHPENQGQAYLITEGGIPVKVKVSYLTDEHIQQLADFAAWIRHPNSRREAAA